jgi:glutaredoxin 2
MMATLSLPTRLFAFGTLSLSTFSRSLAMAAPKSALTLHVYDHCPYCNRAEFLMTKLQVPYARVVHGYGLGAEPSANGGTGYGPGDGPIKLTGKKMLPVLVGEGVPAPAGMAGLPESLEICSYIAACHGAGGVAPATNRPDLETWRAKFKTTCTLLARPRIAQMPVADWSDPRDAAYAVWKYTTKFEFDYADARARTSELLPKASALLSELVPLLRGVDASGAPCLNQWGYSMDDVQLLPELRQLSCVQGVEWPEAVRDYLDANCNDVLQSYAATAVA